MEMAMTAKAENRTQAPPLPEWIRVLPRGTVELSDHREPFLVDEAALRSMAAEFSARGVDLVIDYEHQSLQGERAPAAGWIKELEARGDGLWARVEWTQPAREYLEKKEYRYFSPVLRLDPETRKPVALMHVGLTNVPAIKRLPPLVARWGGKALAWKGARGTEPVSKAPTGKQNSEKEKEKMVEQLKRLMGLQPEVETGAVCTRALEAFRDLAASLDLPGEVSVAQLRGAVEALKAGAARLAETEAALRDLKGRLAGETAGRLVEEALKAGKVSPAQRDWALEYCRRDVEGFKTYVARAPKLVPTGEELQLRREELHDEAGLQPEELAVCRSLKVSPEAYLKARAQIG
jgi:phage I-like protein